MLVGSGVEVGIGVRSASTAVVPGCGTDSTVDGGGGGVAVGWSKNGCSTTMVGDGRMIVGVNVGRVGGRRVASEVEVGVGEVLLTDNRRTQNS